MTLTLRHTVIGGETAEGDYQVYEDGKSIGRIRLGVGLNGQGRWYWNVTVNDPERVANGFEGTFEEAKAAFKTAWNTKKPASG